MYIHVIDLSQSSIVGWYPIMGDNRVHDQSQSPLIPTTLPQPHSNQPPNQPHPRPPHDSRQHPPPPPIRRRPKTQSLPLGKVHSAGSSGSLRQTPSTDPRSCAPALPCGRPNPRAQSIVFCRFGSRSGHGMVVKDGEESRTKNCVRTMHQVAQ